MVHHPLGSHLMSVILGSHIRLICGFMLFIENDGTYLIQGSEYGHPCTDNDSRLAFFDPHPLVGPFPLGQSRVQDSNVFLAESAAHPLNELMSQGNFGDEHYSAFTAFEAFLNGFHIYFGFSRRCNSVDQEVCRFVLIYSFFQSERGDFLLLRKGFRFYVPTLNILIRLLGSPAFPYRSGKGEKA